jgi:hypothetical protein
MAADPFTLATLPLRVAVGAARLGLSLTERLLGPLLRAPERSPEPARAPEPAPAPERERPREPSRRPSPARAAPQRAPAPPPVEAVPEEPPPGHVSEEPVVVAEVADAGAEEGVGPELRVDEPWAGYARMRANDVLARIASATREEVAVVQLYETTHKRRKTVLAAAERRLKLLSPPGR